MPRSLSDAARGLWRGLPIRTERKLRLKHLAFTMMPWVFRRTAAYRDWAALNGIRVPGPPRRHRMAAPRAVTQGDYVPPLDAPPAAALPVKLIAFYLPQFHAIPENDAWWGTGFTEWTKVRPSLPLFEGHEQPHVPGELGWYRLAGSAVPRRQVELARLYGVGGFCFYHYWFAGRLLLEAPVENFLADASLDFPFCLCWANENWSRRWDGLEQEILIAQDHSDEDDIAFIAHIARFLRDPRYIRIDGRPLLLLYRPSLLPDVRATAGRWRRWCRENGVGEIYLAYPQSFDAVDPATFGFDAALEFPPNNSGPPVVTDQVQPIDGHDVPIVYDWSIFPERSRQYRDPGYTLFRGVCPAWDNTARKSSRGAVFLNSTPDGYGEWLRNAVQETCRRRTRADERLVFVNAWNEWAEGAHLEPDLRHGYAYLQATRNALTGETFVPDGRTRIVLVSHDAHPHGAQFLALHLARTLGQAMRCEVHLVCLGAGPLKDAFAQAARLHDLDGKDPRGPEAHALAKRLYASGARVALVNTTVSGHFLETLAQTGLRCTALIHELRGVLEQYGLQAQARAIARHAAHIVCPAAPVASAFAGFAQGGDDRIRVRPQGLYKRADRSVPRAQRRARLRELLGIPPDSRIVLGAGYADARKGVDLFVEAALLSLARDPRTHWVWIGHREAVMRERVDTMLAASGDLRGRVWFPGLQPDTDPYYLGADVFAMTSREDPFPSVILEALDAELPVAGFENAGGFTELAADGVIRLVPHGDAAAMSRAVDALLEPGPERDALARDARRLVDGRFSFRAYARDLLDTLGVAPPRISVVVPNYNYAHHLETRLGSILEQTAAIHEVVFLDDCSADDSVRLATAVLGAADVDHRIIRNEVNSGSVFRQWLKGVEHATGDYVWIAEADDDSEPAFLETVLRGFTVPGTVMSYCESQSIDGLGNRVAKDYADYVRDVDTRHWRSHFANEGPEEIRRYLSIKNTIPNVSAVLFERAALLRVLSRAIEDVSRFRVAGDWRLYVELLEQGGVSFSPIALNRHRRHARGVTLSHEAERLAHEIAEMQRFVASRVELPDDIPARAEAYLRSLAAPQAA